MDQVGPVSLADHFNKRGFVDEGEASEVIDELLFLRVHLQMTHRRGLAKEFGLQNNMQAACVRYEMAAVAKGNAVLCTTRVTFLLITVIKENLGN